MQVPAFFVIGGAERDRTVDLLSARQALSQLSYSPILSISSGLDTMTPRTCQSFYFSLI